jgi:hypothetical protein
LFPLGNGSTWKFLLECNIMVLKSKPKNRVKRSADKIPKPVEKKTVAAVKSYDDYELFGIVLFQGGADIILNPVNSALELVAYGKSAPPYTAGGATATLSDSLYVWTPAYGVTTTTMPGYDWQVVIPAATMTGYGPRFSLVIQRSTPASVTGEVDFTIV